VTWHSGAASIAPTLATEQDLPLFSPQSVLNKTWKMPASELPTHVETTCVVREFNPDAPSAILHEVEQLHKVSTRLEVLAEEHPLAQIGDLCTFEKALPRAFEIQNVTLKLGIYRPARTNAAELRAIDPGRTIRFLPSAASPRTVRLLGRSSGGKVAASRFYRVISST
jgi:hypothetical protein